MKSCLWVVWIVLSALSVANAEDDSRFSLAYEGCVTQSYEWPTDTPTVIKQPVSVEDYASNTDETAKERCGWTSMTLAVVKGNLEQASRLLSAGAEIRAWDQNGHSLLYLADIYERKEMADFLISRGLSRQDKEKFNAGYDQGWKAKQDRIRRPLVSKEDSRIIRETTSTTNVVANANEGWDGLSTVTWKLKKEAKANEPTDGYANYFFKLSDTSDWVDIGPLCEYQIAHGDGASYDLGANWIIPGQLLQIHWVSVAYLGRGGAMTEHRLLVLYKGKLIQHLYSVEDTGGHHSLSNISPARSADTLDMEWDAQKNRLVCRLHSLVSGGGLLIEPDVFQYYRLTEDEVELSEWGGVELGVQPKYPVIYLADEYDMSMEQFLKLNPKLRGKVFCDSPAICMLGPNTNPEWLRKDLARFRKAKDDQLWCYE
jgi:hypothetical protein